MHAEDPRPGLAARHLTKRAEQLLFGARDQRRQKGGHARLEQGLAGDAVVGAARVEEVDAAEAVHLQVDEPGDGDPVADTGQPDAGHDPVLHLDVPRQEGTVDECRCDAQSHRASLRVPSALVNTTSPQTLEVGRFGLYHRAMAEIELDGVGKTYGSVRAVQEVSLRIEDGEFLVLVGPSGCGKSTLLRMIAGLEETTEGEIRIGGRDVTDLPPRKRDVAMVFQTYALYPHLSVRQNIGYGLKTRRVEKSEIARRVADVAALLGLEDLLDRRPAQLSGGQRQRVAMGRAIVRQPQAFLLDEPLSNLDAKLRVGMRASLAQLHQRLGVTTVYVTHDQTEA